MKITKFKAHNYRTLCEIHLSLDSLFTAITGQNDSGKSNIVKVIRYFLDPGDDPYIKAPTVAVKDAYPAWKDDALDNREIFLSLELLIDHERDIGMYQMVQKQLELQDAPSQIRLVIEAAFNSEKRTIRVHHNDSPVDEFIADQIFRSLRSSRALLYHNSTAAVRPYYPSEMHGVLKEIIPNHTLFGEGIQRDVNERLNKAIRGHQKGLADLLGRLEQKYNIGIAAPSINLDYLPIGITLGDKTASVTLDEWGSGTQNRTHILLQLFRAIQISRSSASASKVTPVVLIEEPECFLHHSAQSEFGRVIRDIAQEFGIQVIITSHSPYMLSQSEPSSNVLLTRRSKGTKKYETIVEDVNEGDWVKPFAVALGVVGDELRPWHDLMFSRADSILLVEGKYDVGYLDLLRSVDHGKNQLLYHGEIFAYGGYGNLKNQILLKYVLERHQTVLVTFDLDAKRELEKTLSTFSLKNGVDYLPIGLDEPGKRTIEGYLPDDIKRSVYHDYSSLVTASQSNVKQEADDAKNELKRLHYERFRDVAKPNTADYSQFYKLSKQLNKMIGRKRT